MASAPRALRRFCTAANKQNVLYPPLAYVRVLKVQEEDVGGLSALVATVEPMFS